MHFLAMNVVRQSRQEVWGSSSISIIEIFRWLKQFISAELRLDLNVLLLNVHQSNYSCRYRSGE